ncbi:MAG: hypothetical protein AUH80_00010 [Chloroflexi bacterium 13_1_40CM_4_65_16]|nr:MAG: hypothetical protein AUH80_00010 [Chloroflexi bacterium 13_1_40CM_4_65_16]
MRSWASGIVVLLLLMAGCAAPQKLASSSSPPPASPSAASSLSPSPIAPLAIASVAFHAGEIGFAYAPVMATANGGVPPYRWAVTAGSFPGGLVMGATGKVSGTPSATGNFLFTVQVADAVGGSASIGTSIAVSKHISVAAACPTRQPCSVEAGCVTACGVFGHASGGVAPFTYKVVAGALPTGMGLNGFSLTKAFPSPAKDWIFSVRVTDAIGATAQTTAKFHVFPHIAFTGALAASCSGGGTWGTGCTMQPALPYTLGTPGLALPPVKFSVISGPPLPKDVKFTAQNGTVTGIFPGQTCPSTGYDAVVKLVLVDGSICSSGTYCSSAPATVTVHLLRC